MRDLTGKPTGERIKHFRNRIGMTRPVLGGLVGRSAEWVKAVEGPVAGASAADAVEDRPSAGRA